MKYATLSELPNSLVQALQAIKYNKKDIPIYIKDTYTQQALADKGQRAFTMAVNLQTGETDTHTGSWGGSNMFVSNAVDSDDEIRQLPEGFAIIQGTFGYPKTMATITLHPKNIVAILPAPPELSERQRALLAVIKQHTSPGRKSFWERYRQSKPTPEELNNFVEQGYLKRNKAGAVSITTKGKNAADIDSAVWYCEGKERYYR